MLGSRATYRILFQALGSGNGGIVGGEEDFDLIIEDPSLSGIGFSIGDISEEALCACSSATISGAGFTNPT